MDTLIEWVKGFGQMIAGIFDKLPGYAIAGLVAFVAGVVVDGFIATRVADVEKRRFKQAKILGNRAKARKISSSEWSGDYDEDEYVREEFEFRAEGRRHIFKYKGYEEQPDTLYVYWIESPKEAFIYEKQDNPMLRVIYMAIPILSALVTMWLFGGLRFF